VVLYFSCVVLKLFCVEWKWRVWWNWECCIFWWFSPSRRWMWWWRL